MLGKLNMMLGKLNFPQINKMAKEIVLGKIERITTDNFRIKVIHTALDCTCVFCCEKNIEFVKTLDLAQKQAQILYHFKIRLSTPDSK